jgi:septal ring-binding cell division protein DamX
MPATPQAHIAKRLPTAPASEDTPPANIRFGPLTRQHLAQYDEWIANAPRNHYFIQLLAADATETGRVEGFLARAINALDPVQLRAYRSNLSGRDRVGVIYGDFESREEAAAAMLALPETIKAAQPFPRQVSKLH